MSSLTVARQRGTCTRFPFVVPGTSSDDEFARTQFGKSKITGVANLAGGHAEVNALSNSLREAKRSRCLR